MKQAKKSHENLISNAILIVMIVVLVCCTIICDDLLAFQNQAATINLIFSVVTLAMTILLYFFCINSVAWDKQKKQIFKSMLILFFLTALTILLSIDSTGKAEMHNFNMLLNTLLYLLSAIYWIAFCFFQKGKYSRLLSEKNSEIIILVFWGIYILLVAINHFTGFCFSVETDGSFVVHSSLLFNLTVLWFVIYSIFALSTQCDIKTKLTLASHSFFPLIGWVLIFIFPNTNLYLNTFSSIGMFLYLISLYLLFFNIYLENGRLFLQNEKKLEESRANAMMLKISPHFIANTMSSIVALCYSDAQKAGELASNFAVYLRDNYADVNETAMISFSKELEHIRNYLAIEKIRFPGLNVEYDVQAETFLLPALTAQPLVENAVRHGITKRPDACGTLKISSFERDNDYIICIEDDGVGYNPQLISEEKKHIGISNAKTRLALLCEGSLTITALPKYGTICEIRIPKRGGQNT